MTYNQPLKTPTHPPLSSRLGAADLRTGLRPLVSLVPAHFCPGPPKNKILATPLQHTQLNTNTEQLDLRTATAGLFNFYAEKTSTSM